jgi:hypothetical protein
LKRTKVTEENGVLGKRCSKCTHWKSLEEYHKSKNGVGGVKPNCKDCKRLEERKRNKTDKVLKSSTLEERKGVLGKSCTNCNNWLPLESFYKSVKGLGGRHSTCIPCKKELSAPHVEANRDKRRESSRRYSMNNREHVNEYQRKWRKLNPHYYKGNLTKIKLQRRRGRKQGVISDLTTEEYEKILKHFNYSCALTSEKEGIHMDHVIPLSIGHGGTTYGNIIPLKAELNLSKHDKNIFEWFEANRQRFNLSTQNFEYLIQYLAEVNGVTVSDYREHVYWCYENPQFFDSNGEAI